jgi:hypothetical protein
MTVGRTATRATFGCVMGLSHRGEARAMGIPPLHAMAAATGRPRGALPLPCWARFCSYDGMETETAGLRTRAAVPQDTARRHATKHESGGVPEDVFTRACVLYHGPVSDDAPRNVVTFATETEARAAFARLRCSPTSLSQWAELVGMGPGSPTILAWFGRPSPRFTADKIVPWSIAAHRREPN